MILPGSVIGIIGGGQLGRMTAIAAARLGYKTHIYTPEEDSPASHVAFKTTVADYKDGAALLAFAEKVDVVTFEFENIPHESLALLENAKPVRPGATVLEICRNRVREKSFVNELSIPTTAWRAINSPEELQQAMTDIPPPSVLKTAELGYDGKGQITLRKGEEAKQSEEAFHAQAGILEAFVDFRMEISVIVARGLNGQICCYEPVQNIHKDHILDTTIAPAPIASALAKKAETIALRIAEALNLCGLLAVEMFVTRDDRILVNELAPRPHNSGHWTTDACITGQFEQLIRAICGLPLGSPARMCNAEMKNLIGNGVLGSEQYLADKNARLHLYGKKDIRPGRKMGHVTFLKTKKSQS